MENYNVSTHRNTNICSSVSTMESRVSSMFKFTDYCFFILCIPIYKAGWSRYWGMVRVNCLAQEHNTMTLAVLEPTLSHAGSLSPDVGQNYNMIFLYCDWKVDPVYYQQAVVLSHISKDFVSVNKRKWDVAQLTNFLKWLVHHIFFLKVGWVYVVLK